MDGVIKGGRPEWLAPVELRTIKGYRRLRGLDYFWRQDQECLRGRAACERRCDRNMKGGDAEGRQAVGTGGLRRIGGRLVGLDPSRGGHSLIVIVKGRQLRLQR